MKFRIVPDMYLHLKTTREFRLVFKKYLDSQGYKGVGSSAGHISYILQTNRPRMNLRCDHLLVHIAEAGCESVTLVSPQCEVMSQ